MPIKITSPSEEYGYFLEGDFSDLVDYLKTTPVPEQGNIYVRDDISMHGLSGFRLIQEKVFGWGQMESGYCNGNNRKLNCLESHACPEADIAVNDMILLLALPRDVKDGAIDSKDVIAIRVKAGQCFVLNPYVFHFSPCVDGGKPFRSGVFLSEGTNRDLTEPASDKRLWKENKWLYAHPESVQASQGAYVGIVGENIFVE